ncbi:hypothetical protein BC832DRAFT_52672 [Gaertneriomyces semiglobifer]|nr:hypothetical protein BC832DRAFT_52672 [Gaertneriomyces semiglobifer]
MPSQPMLDDQGLDMTSPSEDEAEEFYLDEGTDEGWDEGLGEGVGDLFEQSVHEEAEAQDIDTAIYKPITIPLDASSTHTALFHAMNGLMQGLATVSHQVSTVHQEVSALKQNVASLNQNVAGVNQKVAAVRRDIGRLNGNVGYLFEKIARNDMLSHIRVTWELEILNPAGLLLHGRTFHFQGIYMFVFLFEIFWCRTYTLLQ